MCIRDRFYFAATLLVLSWVIAQAQNSEMKLGKLDIRAQAPFGGYWEEDTKAAILQTVTLTPEEPSRRVTLRIGPRPGIMNLSLRDKETGEFVWSAQIHLSIASRKLGSSGTGNFEKSESSGLRVPIRPNSDVILEVSAPGYKTWFYTDPTTESQRTLRLESGEQRSISVELEPDPQDAAKEH